MGAASPLLSALHIDIRFLIEIFRQRIRFVSGFGAAFMRFFCCPRLGVYRSGTKNSIFTFRMSNPKYTWRKTNAGHRWDAKRKQYRIHTNGK